MIKRFKLAAMFFISVLFWGVALNRSSATHAQSGAGTFRFYENNPVLSVGAPGEWDADAITIGDVVSHDGIYHMFYSGSAEAGAPFAIGYATSSDGFTWTKNPANPILTPESIIFEDYVSTVGASPHSIFAGSVFVEDNLWVMYFGVLKGPGLFTGASIARATAPSPTGPWTAEPRLSIVPGSQRQWDSGFVGSPEVMATAEGYAMYYFGGGTSPVIAVGLATSPDGLTWTKYDDPATGRPFAESDPTLHPDQLGVWAHSGIFGSGVKTTENGLEMFFFGNNFDVSTQIAVLGLGHARSGDGVSWVEASGNPLWTVEVDVNTAPVAALAGLLSLVPVEDGYFIYSDFFTFPQLHVIHLAFWKPAAE